MKSLARIGKPVGCRVSRAGARSGPWNQGFCTIVVTNMSFNDPVLIAKLAGAVVVFALGIWIGLGMPGARRPKESREWRPADRLRATWINRVFFRMDRAPRRFDTDRLIVPGKRAGEGRPADSGEKPKSSPEVVRLRSASRD